MKPIRGLLITADRFPAQRSDVRVLWEKKMSARHYRLDWIMQSREALDRAVLQKHGSGEVLLGAMDTGRTFGARLRKHWFAIRNECRVFHRLKKVAYDFVLVRDKAIAAALALLAARRAGVPCFFWLSFPFPENSLYRVRQGVARYPALYWVRGHFQFWLLYRVLLPRMDHVFVTSEQMKLDLIAYGIRGDRISAFSMGVDVESMRVAWQQPSAAADRYTLVYLGEMARARGLDFLLRAFQRVHAVLPQAHLLMIGGSENPDDLLWLRHEAAILGVADAVEFTGQLPQQEAWRRLREARVACSPFKPSPVLDSASPTKLAEYLYLGVPAVANQHPEQSRVIAASGCGQIAAWDEDAFAAAALHLLSLDDGAWQAMSERGRQWVIAHRSYDVIAAALDAVIVNLLKESSCPSV
ncbi:MAG TPA: glycosyltransferase [Pseudomonadales bacterium]